MVVQLKEPCIRWGSRSPTGRGTFEEDVCLSVVTYLRMSALRIVCLSLRTNISAQRCGL